MSTRRAQFQSSSNAPKKRKMQQVVSHTGRSSASAQTVNGTRRQLIIHEQQRIRHVIPSANEQAVLQGEELPNVPHGFADPDGEHLIDQNPRIGLNDDGWETVDEQETTVIRLARAKKYYRLTTSYRTRHERSSLHHITWRDLLPRMVGVYLEWKRRIAAGLELDITEQRPGSVCFAIEVLNIFDSPRNQVFVRAHENEDAVLTMLRYGFIACTPLQPSLGINMRTLELYRQLRLHHPRLGFQPFARALAAIAQTPYRTELQQQLTDAFDAYLMMRREVDRQLDAFLGRDSADWRMLNACPPCNYKLTAEPELLIERLWAMDGNGSIKRHAAAGSADTRAFESDIFLDNADLFKDEVKKQTVHPRSRKHVTGAEPGDAGDAGDTGDTGDSALDPLPCQDNWKNMQPEHMKVALDFFKQTGVFLGACRHGLTLKVLEMIQSGELAKYPLALCAHMMQAAPVSQKAGYDIGCGFSTTLGRSSLGQQAQVIKFSPVVNAFHGHAHNRLCQLRHHPLYTLGVGLEDFETCERVFSVSNDVGRTVRFASPYHYRQAIDMHFRHWDDMKYRELSRFIARNYEQALELIEEGEASMTAAAALGFHAEDFERWRLEELKYLESLKQEPAGDLLAIGYVEALIKLGERRQKFDLLDTQFAILTPAMYDAGRTAAYERQLAQRERARRDAMRDLELAENDVRVYEAKVNPAQRWLPTSKEWIDTLVYIRQRKARVALDTLERLVVQRLFELTKANMSDVCYKMRQQIAKALQTRSKAIRTALAKYNEAMKELFPAAEPLEWATVVQWTELSDFSLLRMSRHDIASRPWANAANREFMNKYFKLQRAREEITRCNIEARRLRTWIDDEDRHLTAAVERAVADLSPLAVSLEELRVRRAQIHRLHRIRLQKLELSKGFTGTPGPGTAINPSSPAPALRPRTRDLHEHAVPYGTSLGEDDEGSDEEQLIAAAEEYEAFEASIDDSHL